MFIRAATDEMSCDSDWSAFSIPSKRNFRFHEDDDDTDDIAERMPCSEDDDCNPYENRIVKRCSRQSAQEAAKRFKIHYATSPDEDDDE